MSRYTHRGLDDQQVSTSKLSHGDNSLPKIQIETFWSKLMENFNDPLIKILMVALVITTCLSLFGYAEWFEGLGIASAVFLATFVSTYSEYKNESSFQNLQEQAMRVKSRVFRKGYVKELYVSEIVKNDLVLLQPGDKVPVDGRIIEGSVYVSNQPLTGESKLLQKFVAPEYYAPSEYEFNDQYLIFRESIVMSGEAVVVTDRIGVQTKYGALANEMSMLENRESPLQVKLSRLASVISKLGYIGAILIACSFLFKQIIVDQHYDINAIFQYALNWKLLLKDVVTALILSIIIIVVAVPEGLPMMIAIVLSLNMRKLLASNVLVRRLLGIETAGSLNVLLVDKTGTLTKGTLEAHLLISAGGREYDCIDSMCLPFARLIQSCLAHSSFSHRDSQGNTIGGNATERAILSYLYKFNNNPSVPYGRRRKEIHFDSSNKFSAVIFEYSTDEQVFFCKEPCVSIIKGAPEVLLAHCRHYYDDMTGKICEFDSNTSKARLESRINQLSAQTVRNVAIAVAHYELDDQLADLVLVGILAIADEIREESKDTICCIHNAGIQVIMITGDYEETALAVARQLEMIPQGSPPPGSILTSKQLQLLSDDQIASSIHNLRVVSRAYPTDKSRLVGILQKINLVVGMTGDGVNDASALKKADVGFSMGSGTEVAKEASDIVILDDNLISIANAILYGRTIFKSICKFIVFQSTINLASTLIVFLGPFLGIDFPLTLVQLLWVNLVMDTLAAIAFGGEPALTKYMLESPINRDDSIISPYMWSTFTSNGTFIALISVLILRNSTVLQFFIRNDKTSYDAFLTAFFSYFIFINTFNALNVRTTDINLFKNISKNPGFILVIALIFVLQIIFSIFGGKVLRTIPLYLVEWIYVILASIIILPFDIIRKLTLTPSTTFLSKHYSWRHN